MNTHPCAEIPGMAIEEGIYASTTLQGVDTQQTDHGLTLSPKILSGDPALSESYGNIPAGYDEDLMKEPFHDKQNETCQLTDSLIPPSFNRFNADDAVDVPVPANCPSLIHSSTASRDGSLEFGDQGLDSPLLSPLPPYLSIYDPKRSLYLNGNFDNGFNGYPWTGSQNGTDQGCLSSLSNAGDLDMLLPLADSGSNESFESFEMGGVVKESQESSPQSTLREGVNRASHDRASTTTNSSYHDNECSSQPQLHPTMASLTELLSSILRASIAPDKVAEMLQLLSDVRSGQSNPPLETDITKIMDVILRKFCNDHYFRRSVIIYFGRLICYSDSLPQGNNAPRSAVPAPSSSWLSGPFIKADEHAAPTHTFPWECVDPVCRNRNYDYTLLCRPNEARSYVATRVCFVCGSPRPKDSLDESDRRLQQHILRQQQQPSPLLQPLASQPSMPVRGHSVVGSSLTFPQPSTPFSGNSISSSLTFPQSSINHSEQQSMLPGAGASNHQNPNRVTKTTPSRKSTSRKSPSTSTNSQPVSIRSQQPLNEQQLQALQNANAAVAHSLRSKSRDWQPSIVIPGPPAMFKPVISISDDEYEEEEEAQQGEDEEMEDCGDQQEGDVQEAMTEEEIAEFAADIEGLFEEEAAAATVGQQA